MKTRSIVSAVLLFVTATILTSCFSPFNQIQNPEIPFVRPSYSILPPQEKGWTYVDQAGVDGYVLIFRNESKSKTHTYVGMINERHINASFSSPEEFLSFVKKSSEMNNDVRRYRVLEDKMFLDDRFGAYCISYHRKAEDHGAKQKGPSDFLIMEGYGYTFLHPNNKNIMIDVSYSERGTVLEVDPKLIETAQKFLNGFKIKGSQ